MEDFKRIFNLFVAVIGVLVLFFFKDNMVLNFLDRSERVYLYDEGMVFDGNTACEG